MALYEVHDSWDENRCWNVASVPTTLTTLCTDYISSHLEAFLNVLRVTDHIHVQNAGFVKFLDDRFRGHANRRDEKLGSGVDYDVNEFIELSFCVVVAT